MPDRPFDALAPKQSLGQNFMADPNTIRKVADTLQADAEAHVVEIGPGTGALTEELAERYDRLTALEIDERAVMYLRQHLPAVDVRHVDVLEADYAALAEEKGGPLYVIGNVPYNIGSQILFGLMAAAPHVAEGVITLQRQVVDRIVAEPRTKAYGILSVLLQLYTRPTRAFRISRHVFRPPPDVESAVLHFTMDGPLWDLPDDERPPLAFLHTVVRTAFNQRRKTLRNSLHPWTRGQGLTLPDDWEGRRAEELRPTQFITLTQHLRAQGADEQAGV
jgi:16S rRNA (adenine1518-N6/adenine1519-N6)-dimethyltransferase